jgi:hypothetical protein
VVQINRQMGAIRFTIHIQEHTSVQEDKTLPHHFTVAYWDTNQERLMRMASYTDRYIWVEGYYLPASRRILIYDDQGMSTHVIEFGDHQLA